MGAVQTAECGHAAEADLKAGFRHGNAALEERSCAIQPDERQIQVRRLPKGARECAMKMISGKAGFPRHSVEREAFTDIAMHELARDLKSSEEFLLRGASCGRHASNLLLDLFV